MSVQKKEREKRGKAAACAIVPGSYDPVTKGHMYLIEYAAKRYESVRAVIFVNPEKEYMFTASQRLEMLRVSCEELPNVTVDSDEGMQYLYAKKYGATRSVRGWRNETDLAYERKWAKYHEEVLPEYKTILVRCPKSLQGVSSTAVRKALREGKDPSFAMPPKAAQAAVRFWKNKEK